MCISICIYPPPLLRRAISGITCTMADIISLAQWQTLQVATASLSRIDERDDSGLREGGVDVGVLLAQAPGPDDRYLRYHVGGVQCYGAVVVAPHAIMTLRDMDFGPQKSVYGCNF